MIAKSTASSINTDQAVTTRAWVDIDLGALLRNGEALAKQARVPLLPMVKADAYGLGVEPVVRTLSQLDPFGFGVATIEEGAELRGIGVAKPVIVFTPMLPADYARVRAANLIPALSTASSIAAWKESGGGTWHLAVDTGVGRAGVRWDHMGTVADMVSRFPPDGMYSHFHSSELDDGSMEIQEQRFRDAIAALPHRPAVLHIDNSGSIVRRSPSPWSVVRPGVFLYGSGSGERAAIQPEPVAHLRARVVELRDLNVGDSVGYGATWKATRPSRVATLAVGYADGYRRSLGNRGEVLVHGKRFPVIGTVMMDMVMLDVTGGVCALGDVATLVGSDGGDLLSVDEVGTRAGLNAYELLTGLRQRILRIAS